MGWPPPAQSLISILHAHDDLRVERTWVDPLHAIRICQFTLEGVVDVDPESAGANVAGLVQTVSSPARIGDDGVGGDDGPEGGETGSDPERVRRPPHADGRNDDVEDVGVSNREKKDVGVTT